MLFNSIDFVFFLPTVFFLYWFVTQRQLKLQNTLIVIASYVFYGWWDWRFLSLIIISTGIDYIVGLKLGLEERQTRRKFLLLVSLIVNLGFLGFFKYYNFFLESFVSAFRLLGNEIQGETLNIILPVGISFYTFQTLSYTIDIYNKKLEPTKNIIAFSAFVSFFPQLVAGPIERAKNLLPQFHKPRKFNYNRASTGLKLILWGLFMKVVIADRISIYVDTVYGNVGMHSGISLVLATVFFAIQIYCDFAGYSIIALGTARLFGIHLMTNFKRPYFALSFKEFWSRWHISLSTWFRDYVYIPLGGSRHGSLQTNRNLVFTFVISGLWHGANWTFVIWGFLHGLFLVFEKMLQTIQLPTLLKWVLVFLLTNLAWVFFRAASLGEAFTIFQKFLEPGFYDLYLGDVGGLLFAGIGIIILILNDLIAEFFPQKGLFFHPSASVRFFAIVFILTLIMAIGVFDGSQFIYFQF
jgi:alginate O-acetyltransferase complex protein AlgI